MNTITKEQRNDSNSSERSGTTPDLWTKQLPTQAAGLFATNPTASAVWHTPAEQQALSDILRLLAERAPEHQDRADPAYDDALTLLRNLHASFADNPEALVLRDQLRTITNHDAHERLRYVIDHYRPDPRE